MKRQPKMKQKIFKLNDLHDKSLIRFYSEDGQIDFAKESTQVRSDIAEPFHAELHIHERNQKNTTVFDIDIPVKRHSATIILTAITGYDIQKVNCKVL